MGQSTSCFQLSEADCIGCNGCTWTADEGCTSTATQADWNSTVSTTYYLAQLLVIAIVVVLIGLKIASFVFPKLGSMILSPLYDMSLKMKKT